MFKRKTITDVDLLNKLNTIENKLDIFTLQYVSLTTSQTNKNDEKIYNDEVSVAKPTCDEEICKPTCDEKIYYTSFLNDFSEKLISNIYIKNNDNLQNLKIFFNENDQKLRSDLHSFILGIKQEICKEINDLKIHFDFNDTKDTKNIKDIKDTLTLVSNNVDGFFFDNETIKHQLQIEEDIRKYMDDIDAIKISINNINNDITSVISKLN